MTTHTLLPSQQTLHGQYHRELAPALTIDPGDEVVVQTYDVSWGMGQHQETWRPKFEPRVSPKDDGPCLCGPIAVRGAKPGMALRVRLDEIRPGDWGWTWSGPSVFHKDLLARVGLGDHPNGLLRWAVDADAKTALSERGHKVALDPFLGMIGLASDREGWQSGWFPQRTGGNLDCRALTAGSTIYFPVEVEGALLSLGDGHGRQGDGEVAGSAIECPMERVRLHIDLCERPLIPHLYAGTPYGWVTFGLSEDLDEAVGQALSAALDLLQARLGVGRQEALFLASAVVDLRVTQLVNKVRGVHAVLPHDAFLPTTTTTT
jgi:acetamidase/formamidase